ncbi:MAG TPA: hypothetical protein VFO52_14670 [Longimicrobiales bacterium]|nr:hypothetical protein [Longimicrobiales bacterium]
MTWLLVIALVFMGVPIAEAIASRIKKGGGSTDDKEVQKALKLTEQRLAASETRIAQLEERVDFYEKLLSAPKDRPPSNPESY